MKITNCLNISALRVRIYRQDKCCFGGVCSILCQKVVKRENAHGVGEFHIDHK